MQSDSSHSEISIQQEQNEAVIKLVGEVLKENADEVYFPKFLAKLPYFSHPKLETSILTTFEIQREALEHLVLGNINIQDKKVTYVYPLKQFSETTNLLEKHLSDQVCTVAKKIAEKTIETLLDDKNKEIQELFPTTFVNILLTDRRVFKAAVTKLLKLAEKDKEHTFDNIIQDFFDAVQGCLQLPKEFDYKESSPEEISDLLTPVCCHQPKEFFEVNKLSPLELQLLLSYRKGRELEDIFKVFKRNQNISGLDRNEFNKLRPFLQTSFKLRKALRQGSDERILLSQSIKACFKRCVQKAIPSNEDILDEYIFNRLDYSTHISLAYLLYYFQNKRDKNKTKYGPSFKIAIKTLSEREDFNVEQINDALNKIVLEDEPSGVQKQNAFYNKLIATCDTTENLIKLFNSEITKKIAWAMTSEKPTLISSIKSAIIQGKIHFHSVKAMNYFLESGEGNLDPRQLKEFILYLDDLDFKNFLEIIQNKSIDTQPIDFERCKKFKVVFDALLNLEKNQNPGYIFKVKDILYHAIVHPQSGQAIRCRTTFYCSELSFEEHVRFAVDVIRNTKDESIVKEICSSLTSEERNDFDFNTIIAYKDERLFHFLIKYINKPAELIEKLVEYEQDALWDIISSALTTNRDPDLSTDEYISVFRSLVTYLSKNPDEGKFHFVIDKVLSKIDSQGLTDDNMPTLISAVTNFLNLYPAEKSFKLLLAKPQDANKYYFFEKFIRFLNAIDPKAAKDIFNNWVGDKPFVKTFNSILAEKPKLESMEEGAYFYDQLRKAVVTGKLHIRSGDGFRLFFQHYPKLKIKELKKFIKSLSPIETRLFLNLIIRDPKSDAKLLSNQPMRLELFNKFLNRLRNLIYYQLHETNQPIDDDFARLVKDEILKTLQNPQNHNNESIETVPFNKEIYQAMKVSAHMSFALHCYLYYKEHPITKQAIKALIEFGFIFDDLHSHLTSADDFNEDEEYTLEDLVEFYKALINESNHPASLMAELFSAKKISDKTTAAVMLPILSDKDSKFFDDFLNEQYIYGDGDVDDDNLNSDELRAQHNQVLDYTYDDDSIFNGYKLDSPNSTPGLDIDSGDNNSVSKHNEEVDMSDKPNFFRGFYHRFVNNPKLIDIDIEQDAQIDESKIKTKKRFIEIFRTKLMDERFEEFNERYKEDKDLFLAIVQDEELDQLARSELMELFFHERNPDINFFFNDDIYGSFFEDDCFWDVFGDDRDENKVRDGYAILMDKFTRIFWKKNSTISESNLKKSKMSTFYRFLNKSSKMYEIVTWLEDLFTGKSNIKNIDVGKTLIDTLVTPRLSQENGFNKIREFFFARKRNDVFSSELYCHFIITKLKHRNALSRYNYFSHFCSRKTVDIAITLAEHLQELEYLSSHSQSLENLDKKTLKCIHDNLVSIINCYYPLYSGSKGSDGLCQRFNPEREGTTLSSCYDYEAGIRAGLERSFLTYLVNDKEITPQQFVKEYIGDKLEGLKHLVQAIELKIEYDDDWALNLESSKRTGIKLSVWSTLLSTWKHIKNSFGALFTIDSKEKVNPQRVKNSERELQVKTHTLLDAHHPPTNNNRKQTVKKPDGQTNLLLQSGSKSRSPLSVSIK